jgi:2-oxoglutarate dehydrogenase E2 component (dihydrolipoamide succinyltransferase)
MADKGLSRDQVEGTGRDGRVMKEDVLKALAQPPKAPSPTRPPAPAAPSVPRAPVPAEDAAREERVKMTRLRQTIARRLKEAQNTAAMLTTYNEVDMTGIMELRNDLQGPLREEARRQARLHVLLHQGLLPRAEGGARGQRRDRRHRRRLQELRPHGHRRRHALGPRRAGGARRRPDVLRRDREAINELGLRARDGKLSMAEMQGGTFTISNGGVYGSLMSSPILNPPQSGILGMHKIQERPMVVKGQIVPRPMMYLALSYDHRVVDGKGAVTFLVRVKEALEDPRRLLMDLSDFSATGVTTNSGASCAAPADAAIMIDTVNAFDPLRKSPSTSFVLMVRLLTSWIQASTPVGRAPMPAATLERRPDRSGGRKSAPGTDRRPAPVLGPRHDRTQVLRRA